MLPQQLRIGLGDVRGFRVRVEDLGLILQGQVKHFMGIFAESCTTVPVEEAL